LASLPKLDGARRRNGRHIDVSMFPPLALFFPLCCSHIAPGRRVSSHEGVQFRDQPRSICIKRLAPADGLFRFLPGAEDLLGCSLRIARRAWGGDIGGGGGDLSRPPRAGSRVNVVSRAVDGDKRGGHFGIGWCRRGDFAGQIVTGRADCRQAPHRKSALDVDFEKFGEWINE
jgi:hypothetical protein